MCPFPFQKNTSEEPSSELPPFFLPAALIHLLNKNVSVEWVMMTFTGENFENRSSVGKCWFGLDLKILKGEGSVLFSA